MKIVNQVTEIEALYVRDLLKALRTECDGSFDIGHKIVDDEFEQMFRATLLISHVFLNAPLSTGSFESAFIRAAEGAGRTVVRAPDGQRFWDVDVDGKKISLKSTAEKKLNLNKLKISKLCEAAWIQDMRGQGARADRTKALFAEYVNTVDSIIMLRVFRNGMYPRMFGKDSYYELVEIPARIFIEIGSLPASEFAADGPTLSLPHGASSADFKVKLDRSDSKITISAIDKRVCRVLAHWRLPAEVIGDAQLTIQEIK